MNIKDIEKHLSHDDYLEQNDVLKIINEYPEYMYKGKAYRVLFFSIPTEKCDVSEDYSFSRSLNGIKYYSSLKDSNYYKFVHLYECEIKGLDLIKLNDLINLKNTQMISREEEIVLGTFYESDLIFNGSFEEFDEFLTK